jgi:hypothetical protein
VRKKKNPMTIGSLRRHPVIGEFMWDWLHPSVSGFAGTPNVDGHSNLYALTANYRFELRGKTLGTYFIAGGADIFAIQA